MKLAEWLLWQRDRRDGVGDVARLLVGWCSDPAEISYGPHDLNELVDLVLWAAVAAGDAARDRLLYFHSAAMRVSYEWRMSLTGQPALTPGQRRAVCS